MVKFLQLFLISIFLCSCDRSKNIDFKFKEYNKLSQINIQPFGEMHSSYSNAVLIAIQKYFSNTVLFEKITLPPQAFYKERNRYRADSIIRILKSQTKYKEVTIGICNEDISTTKNKIKDFGVMGLGYQPGNACLASTFRLNKKNTLEQLIKVCLHELGHTQGLPHCSNVKCFMQDAEGKNKNDAEKEFCKSCSKFLNSKGWKIKN